MTAAVILAAGRSTRMGRPKALLPHFRPDSTFLTHLIESARAAGTTPIVVVTRPDTREFLVEAERQGAVLVDNPNADLGQLSSLLTALDAFGSAVPEAMLVMPVDVPIISKSVLRRLMDAAAASDAAIVRAAYRGHHGHPVLFKRSVFDELRRADLATGARAVVRADPARVLDVDTDEPGVLIDVDTPADYARVFGRQL